MSQVELIRVCMKGSETTISFAADHLNRFDSARQLAVDFCDLIENGICRSHPIDQINVNLEASSIESAAWGSMG